MNPTSFVLCTDKHITPDSGSGKCAHPGCAAAICATFPVSGIFKR